MASDRRKRMIAVVNEGGLSTVTEVAQEARASQASAASAGEGVYSGPLPSLASRRSSYESSVSATFAAAGRKSSGAAAGTPTSSAGQAARSAGASSPTAGAPARRIQTPRKGRPEAPPKIVPPIASPSASRGLPSRTITTPAHRRAVPPAPAPEPVPAAPPVVSYRNKVYAVPCDVRSESGSSHVFEAPVMVPSVSARHHPLPPAEGQGGEAPAQDRACSSSRAAAARPACRISALKGKMEALERQLDRLPTGSASSIPETPASRFVTLGQLTRPQQQQQQQALPDEDFEHRLEHHTAELRAQHCSEVDHLRRSFDVKERSLRADVARLQEELQRSTCGTPAAAPASGAAGGCDTPSAVRRRIAAAQATAEQPSYEMSVLRETLQHEEATTRRLRERLAHAESESARHAEEAKAAEAQAASLQGDLALKARVAESLEQELATRADSELQERHFLAEKIEVLEGRIANAEPDTFEDVHLLYRQLGEKDLELRGTRESLTEAHSRIASLRHELLQHASDRDTFRAERADLEEQIELLKADFLRLSAFIRDQEEAGQGGGGMCEEEVEEALAEKDALIAMLQGEVAEMSADMTRFRSHLGQKDRELAALREQLPSAPASPIGADTGTSVVGDSARVIGMLEHHLGLVGDDGDGDGDDYKTRLLAIVRRTMQDKEAAKRRAASEADEWLAERRRLTASIDDLSMELSAVKAEQETLVMQFKEGATPASAARALPSSTPDAQRRTQFRRLLGFDSSIEEPPHQKEDDPHDDALDVP